MSLRESSCSCVLPEGMHGAHGWHWQPDPKHPDFPQMDQAVEQCPPFMRALIASREQARRAGHGQGVTKSPRRDHRQPQP